MPASMISAPTGGRPKVMGSSIATVAMVPMPGSTPTSVPTSAPVRHNNILAGIGIEALAAKSRALSTFFADCVARLCPDLVCISPADPHQRGSQLSYRHPHAYALSQALIARGVVGDFRAPDIMRFGFTPLYIGEAEVDRAVEIIAEVMREALWDRAEYRQRAAVT